MNPSLVLCTVSSNDYLHYLEHLLASTQANLPNALFHVVLVNVDKDKDSYLKSLYDNLEIYHEFLEFERIEDQRGYCSNRRSSFIPYLLKRYDSPLVWVDTDSLFINSAEELVKYAGMYDLSAMYTEDHPSLTVSNRKFKNLPRGPLGTPYYGVFSAGVITTNNSPTAKKFFNSFEIKVKESPYGWPTDQEALYLIYDEYKSLLKFNNLPEKFWGRLFNDDNILYVPKGYYRDKGDFPLVGAQYVVRLRNWPVQKAAKNKSSNGIIDVKENAFTHYFKRLIYRILKKIMKKVNVNSIW